MPYYISDKQADCNGWALIKLENDKPVTVACHATKKEATAQMIAVSMAEGMKPLGEYFGSGMGEERAAGHDVPEYMREAARLGLKYYADGKGGAGLVDKTIREARLMAAGEVSNDKWIRIAAWIARHLGDLDSPDANPKSDNYPSPGVVAHLLWGSGSNKAEAQRTLDYANSVVAQINKESQRDAGEGNNRVVICDIDDTLIHNGMLIADTADFVASQEVGIELVTGRLEATRAETVAQLAKLGMDYDHLYMNDLGSTAKSVEFKKLTAQKLLQNYDVVLAIDNDGGARAAYASLGIPVIDPTRLPAKREMIPVDQNDTTVQDPSLPVQETQNPMEEPAVPCTKQDLELRLRDLLGDVVTFKFLAHGFHWNVRGINFSQFHEFFGEIYEDADGSIDGIGESIRKLNYDAPFQLKDFMESADELEPTDSSDPLEMSRSLYMANEDVRESIVHAIYVADELGEQGILNFLAERQDMHSKWQWQLRAIVGDSFAKNYEIDVQAVSEGTQTGEGNEKPQEIDTTPQGNPQSDYTNPTTGAPMVQMNSTATKWTKAAELIKRRLEPVQEVPVSEERGKKIETRINHVDMEMRATDSTGMTFEGYASVFNSPSEPIGGKFTEYVAPGAFKRSLANRNDIKLLWNHDTSQVLGSTRAGTLQLTEDAHGLKAIATLPPTQLGKDAAVLLKRGDVANMSFGFTVPAGGDSWNSEGNVRTLNSVRLHEVSIVAFPAYSASSASVRTEIRSTGTIDADVLAEGLMRLENGETLDPAQAELINDVVSKLVEQNVVTEAAGILDLKKKQLDLKLKAI